MRRGAAIAGALAIVAGCADDAVDPITRITRPRVIAVTTEPSALALDGALELIAWTVDPGGPRIGIGAGAPPGGRPVDAVRMRACTPWRFIADPARDCVGADALALAARGDGHGVAAAALVAAFPAPPGSPPGLEAWRAVLAAGRALRVPIIVEVDVDGETLVARRDVEVVAPEAARHNPRITALRFDGVATTRLRAGQRYVLTVALDPASLDELPDAARPGQREAITCSLYGSAGELADHQVEVVAGEPAADTEPAGFTPGPPGPAWLYVVATDETGGMTAVAWSLTIE